MTWMDDIASQFGGQVGALPAGAFPAPLPSEIESAKADEAAARWAEKQRKEQEAALLAAQARAGLTAPPPMAPVAPPMQSAPDASSPAVQMALGNQPANVAPAPFSMAGPGQDGVPPSVKLAAAMSPPAPAPPPAAPPGAVQTPPGGPQAAAPPPMPPPMPPPGPDSGRPMPPATDVGARRRGPVAAPMSIAGPAAAPASAAPSGMDRLGDALLGFGGALQGDRGAMTEHIVGQRQALELQAQADNRTSAALLKAGAPPELVSAALRDKEVRKAAVDQYLAKSKYKLDTLSKDEFGNERKAFVNENDPTDIIGIDGKPLKAGGGGAIEGSPSAYLAKGVSAVNHDLIGDDYLKQYSPEMQAAVKDYMAGKAMPTANPRKGWAENVTKIAQKYGADIGQPADAATFGARRTMRNDLAKSSPASIGGQITIGNTALGHLADMSQKATELGNVDVGLAGPSHVINNIRGMTSAQAAKMDALKGAAQHYGQEVTKFYSGSPGGEAERNRFMESVDAAKTPQQLAAVIETEAALMRDRISSLQSNIQATLGDEGVKEYPVIRPVGQKSIAQIGENVSRLRGHAAPTSEAPAAAPVKPGKYVWTPDKGLVPK